MKLKEDYGFLFITEDDVMRSEKTGFESGYLIEIDTARVEFFDGEANKLFLVNAMGDLYYTILNWYDEKILEVEREVEAAADPHEIHGVHRSDFR